MFRKMRNASKTRREWERLFDSGNAYRPPGHGLSGEGLDAMQSLWELGNVGKEVGLTSGDAGEIGVAAVKTVDAEKDVLNAVYRVLDEVSDGTIGTVGGRPLREVVEDPEQVVSVAQAAIIAARPEAYAEYMSQRGEG